MATRSRAATRTLDQPERVRTDGSKRPSETDHDSLHARVAKVTAYEKYKQQLNEFFDGKRELPQNLKDMLATRPGASDHGFEEDDTVTATEPAKKKKRGKKDAQKAPEPEGAPRRRVSASADRRNALIADLRKASSPRESESAVDALRAEGFSLPLEIELLSKALGHPNEGIVEEALQGLDTVIDGPLANGATLLRTRIKNAGLMASSGDVQALCKAIEAKLSA